MVRRQLADHVETEVSGNVALWGSILCKRTSSHHLLPGPSSSRDRGRPAGKLGTQMVPPAGALATSQARDRPHTGLAWPGAIPSWVLSVRHHQQACPKGPDEEGRTWSWMSSAKARQDPAGSRKEKDLQAPRMQKVGKKQHDLTASRTAGQGQGTPGQGPLT